MNYNLFRVITIKIYVPDYFEKFNCIADRCPDTCCAGWEVNLDNESAEKYKKACGCIGDELRSRLEVDEDGDYIFTLTENNRCPFLNDNKLCRLYIELGEESLSQTCKLFPRFYDDFGNFREMGLGLGCPEAARIILENKKSIKLIEYGEENIAPDEVDGEFLKLLISLRQNIFDIINADAPFKDKVSEILTLTLEIQESIDGENVENSNNILSFDDCISVLENMEYIDKKRKNTLLSLDDSSFDKGVFEKYKNDFNKILEYFIFRYLLKSVYDYDILPKVKYGVFACAVIGRLYAKGIEHITAAYGFSKEIEYSDINLEILDDALYSDFNIKSLIGLF